MSQFSENEIKKIHLNEDVERFLFFQNDEGGDCLLKVERNKGWRYRDTREDMENVFTWVCYDEEMYSDLGEKDLYKIKDYEVPGSSHIVSAEFEKENLVFPIYLKDAGVQSEVFTRKQWLDELKDGVSLLGFGFADKEGILRKNGWKELDDEKIEKLFKAMEWEAARETAAMRGDVFDIDVIGLDDGKYYRGIADVVVPAESYGKDRGSDYLKKEVNIVLSDFVEDKEKRRGLIYKMFSIDEDVVFSMTSVKKPDWVCYDVDGNYKQKVEKLIDYADLNEKTGRAVLSKLKISDEKGREIFLLERSVYGKEGGDKSQVNRQINVLNPTEALYVRGLEQGSHGGAKTWWRDRVEKFYKRGFIEKDQAVKILKDRAGYEDDEVANGSIDKWDRAMEWDRENPEHPNSDFYDWSIYRDSKKTDYSERFYFEKDFNKKSADLFLQQWDKQKENELKNENKNESKKSRSR